MSRKIAQILPGGQSEGFAYDLDGNQMVETNFNGAIITNLFDVMNRQIERIYPNGTSNTFTYTLTGRRATMNDASGGYAYSYDSRDRLLTNSGPVGTLIYGYDLNGNVTGIKSSTANGTSVTYQYDLLNRLTNVIDGRLTGAQNTAYHFDLAGNLQGIAYPNTVTNLYQYDALNRVTNVVWKTGSSPLANFGYILGATGNRTNLNETVNSLADNYTWQYDHLYRLTNETVSGTPSGSLFYQYDGVGNRLSRTTGLGLPSQSLGYNTNDWLTSDTYDNDGNTVASVGTNYLYDYENRLTNANNGRVIVVYDGDGNRVKKIIGTTTTLYLVDTLNPSGYPQVFEELTVNSGVTNLSRAYTWGLGLISERIPNSSTNFYGFDGHGSTRFLTGLNGTIENTYAYDAFGNVINSTGATPNNFLYCCYQFDPDIGLVYDNARYLNLNTGRFWTRDSQEGNNEDPLSLHRYLYAADDPVNTTDLSGDDAAGNIGAVDNFNVNLNVGLVGEIGLTPNATLGPGGSLTVDQIHTGQDIPLQNGTVTVHDFEAIPPSGHHDPLDLIKAHLSMVPDITESGDITYKWRQYVTTDDPDPDWQKRVGKGSHLDVYRNATTQWYLPPTPGSDDAQWLSSANAYTFSDTPETSLPILMLYGPGDPGFHDSTIHFNFTTQLVQLTDPYAASGGTVVLTVKWGYWFTYANNGITSSP